MNKSEMIREVLDGLRMVMAPLWHSSRANTHQFISESYGITTSQFHTLRRIKNGAQSVSELAECLHVSSPNISRAVDELVQKGYVTRERLEEDRRRWDLSLTPKAEKLFLTVHKKLDERLEKEFGQLSVEEVQKLIDAIAILSKVVTPKKEEKLK